MVTQSTETIPEYINLAKTNQTVAVKAIVDQKVFDILLDLGSPIRPRLMAFFGLSEAEDLDWFPIGAF